MRIQVVAADIGGVRVLTLGEDEFRRYRECQVQA